jgi:hypothetical protein
MSLSLSHVLNGLVAHPGTKGNAGMILSSIASANAPASNASALLQQLVAGMADPVVTAQNLTAIEQLPGIPSGVVSEIGAIRAAGSTSTAVMAALPSLEAAINTMSTPPSILGMTL